MCTVEEAPECYIDETGTSYWRENGCYGKQWDPTPKFGEPIDWDDWIVHFELQDNSPTFVDDPGFSSQYAGGDTYNMATTVSMRPGDVLRFEGYGG